MKRPSEHFKHGRELGAAWRRAAFLFPQSTGLIPPILSAQQFPRSSFFAQRDQGIHAGGALRRNVAGEKRDSGENRGGGKESKRIGWRNAEKHGLEKPRHYGSSRET